MEIVRRFVIAAALVLAACGGGDTPEPAQDQAGTTATDAGGDGGGEFDCNDAMSQFLIFNQDYSYSVRRGTAPEPVDYDQLADDLEAFAATAPADISETMDDYAGRVVPYWRDLAAMGFDPSDPGSSDPDAYAAATSNLDGPAVDQSATEVQEWLAGPCEDG